MSRSHRRITTHHIADTLLTLGARHPARLVVAALFKWLAAQRFGRRLPRLREQVRARARHRGLIEYETARPLSNPEQQAVQAVLHQAMPQASVSFRTNPAILGGYRLSGASGTVDSSLHTKLVQLGKIMEVAHDR